MTRKDRENHEQNGILITMSSVGLSPHLEPSLFFCSGDSGSRFDGNTLSIAAEHKAIVDSLASPIKLLQPLFNVKRDQFVQSLALEMPAIVHFAGHGENRKLTLLGEYGIPSLVSIEDATAIFANLPCRPLLVILNACHSFPVAQAISDLVPFVIGTPKILSDQVAVRFAENFYKFLLGCPIGSAFDLAIQAIGGSSIPDEQRPQLLKKDRDRTIRDFFPAVANGPLAKSVGEVTRENSMKIEQWDNRNSIGSVLGNVFIEGGKRKRS